MRISDWSSDVCSSDLDAAPHDRAIERARRDRRVDTQIYLPRRLLSFTERNHRGERNKQADGIRCGGSAPALCIDATGMVRPGGGEQGDRKRGVEGKGGSGRGDSGGRRRHKKKKKN